MTPRAFFNAKIRRFFCKAKRAAKNKIGPLTMINFSLALIFLRNKGLALFFAMYYFGGARQK